MGSIDHQKLEGLIKQVAHSDLPQQHQDMLIDNIRTAVTAANGSTDKIGDLTTAFLSSVLTSTRDAIYRREELRTIVDDMLEKHSKDCPLQKWDGKERRGLPVPHKCDDEPTVSVKTKWFGILAKGDKGMEPIIRLVKILAISTVAIYALYKTESLSAGIKENTEILQYNAIQHQNTAALVKKVEAEVVELKK